MSFFSSRPQAKAALDAAAADLSALLAPTHFTGISPAGTPNVNLISGFNGATHVDTNWDLQYTNPATGALDTIASPTIAADTMKVFVGMNAIGAGFLGEGAPGGAQIAVGATGSGSQVVGATANMQNLSNTYMGRGAGPTISSFTGSLTLGGTTASFSLNLGVLLGSLSFNNDTDGVNGTDSLATLDNFWHYNHLTAVASGKSDFYSVALHELMHTLGFGASDTWTGKASGTTWLGANGIAANGGTGANLIDPDGAHIRSGYMSTNIYTGLAQESPMDPSLSFGTRKMMTAIDVAVLKDLGYTVAPVPEPGSALLFSGAALGALLARRRR